MRREVEQRMRRGERFTDVEDVIDASDLPADEKSALWLARVLFTCYLAALALLPGAAVAARLALRMPRPG